MRYLFIVFGLFVSLLGHSQSQGITNAQTKLRPNQLRWSPTDATLDSVYIIRADTATGEPGWYLVTLGGSSGTQDTTLAGDVIGGLNSTFVRKINGVTVENKTPQGREVLQYNGTQWTPDSIDLADLPQMNASRLLGRGSTTSGAPEQLTAGTGLRISSNVLETHLTAGTGIVFGGGNPLTITNTAPDQTVSIAGSGINTVSGTYPSFTVTGTEVDGSTTNEIQTLSRPLTGTLRLTKNGASDFVNLPDSSASNELQTLSAGTNSLTLSQSGGTVTVDTDPSNEIQTIDTLTVASGLLRLKLSGSAVKTLATSNFATSPAGSSMQVQYNNAGSFGALDSFTVSANPDRVGIGVPVPTARLDIQGSGSTSATNALRIRNSAGTGLMTLRNDGQLQVNTNTEASKSSLLLNGTGFSGGTATTTKPTFLIEPTGATSTGWGTLGTIIGVNAESGFKGNLIDLQVNGSSYMKYNANFPSFALGASTASANYSFASGYLNTSSGAYSSTFGRNNTVNNSNGGAFGAFNTVSGNTSYAFGYDNNITGNYTVGFGLNCLTNINGQFAMSSGGFGGYGDAQTSDIRLFNAITGTASTELFTDGVSAKATLSSNMAWTFTIKLIAITRIVGNGTGTLGDIFSGEYTGTIKNIGGTTALVGSITTVGTNSNTSMSTSAVAITADDTSDNLKITFTPPSTAGSTTVTRVASVVYIQTVAY